MRADSRQHLTAAAERRHLECTARVIAALDGLHAGQGAVSVAAVAAAAGVSRTFLYNPAQHDLLARLRAIAAGRSRHGRAPVPVAQHISTASHEQVVRALRARNQRLAEENTRLRDELAVALGQLREHRRGTARTTA
jgi:cell division protein FtsB